MDFQFFTIEQSQNDGSIGTMFLTGRFQTDQLGTFNTGEEIESFLNTGVMLDGGFIGAAYDTTLIGPEPTSLLHVGSWSTTDNIIASVTATSSELTIVLPGSRSISYGGGNAGTFFIGDTFIGADIVVETPIGNIQFPPSGFIERPFGSAVTFSAIPEPAVPALLGVTLGLAFRRRRGR